MRQDNLPFQTGTSQHGEMVVSLSQPNIITHLIAQGFPFVIKTLFIWWGYQMGQNYFTISDWQTHPDTITKLLDIRKRCMIPFVEVCIVCAWVCGGCGGGLKVFQTQIIWLFFDVFGSPGCSICRTDSTHDTSIVCEMGHDCFTISGWHLQ